MIITLLERDKLFSMCFGCVLDKLDVEKASASLTSHLMARKSFIAHFATALQPRLHLLESKHIFKLITLLDAVQTQFVAKDLAISDAAKAASQEFFAKVSFVLWFFFF